MVPAVVLFFGQFQGHRIRACCYERLAIQAESYKKAPGLIDENLGGFWTDHRRPADPVLAWPYK
jgi:hypothetical protein